MEQDRVKRKYERKLTHQGIRLKRSFSHHVKKHRYGLGTHDCHYCPPNQEKKHLPLRENRQSNIDKEDPRVQILDPFKIPMQCDTTQHSGKSFVRTVQGFYKPIYLVLMNTELYVYASHSATKHDDMYALGQNMGIAVRSMEPIPQTAELMQ